jgi:ankyrin repeat protein
MIESNRRQFLKVQLACAGLAALAPARLLGAEVTAAGESVTERFLAAVAAGELERVRALLAQDPGLVSALGADRRSAFALALLNRHHEVASLLLEKGYEPDLHESALALDWERLETLASPAPALVNGDHPVGGTAMYAAAVGGAGNQMWRVYQYGGDPNLIPPASLGVSPLRAGLDHPDLATAEMTASSLLGNGADPNPPSRDGSSPLHAAAARGSRDLVEMLIRKGAVVAARDGAGRTALEVAAAQGHERVAELLRREGEIPRDHSTSRRAYDAAGNPYTAPDLGAFAVVARSQVVGLAHTDFDEVQRRLELHPELAHAVATTTEAAVEASAHMGRRDLVDYLLDKGAPYSLLTAVMKGDTQAAARLLAEDPLRIHERGPHDFALLWYPIIGRCGTDMAELLLYHGAEVEQQHYLGTTALHFAALGGDIEMAALMIEHGADVNRVGRKFSPEGQTPLALARQRGRDEVAELLLAHGARG